MAVIYMPPNPNNIAGGLGQGVGQGISTYMQQELMRRQQQEQADKQIAAIHAVQAAKSREEAFGYITPDVVHTPQDLAVAMKVIDALHPPSDTTPTLVKGYDPSAKEVDRYVPKGRLGELNNPSVYQSLMGPGVSPNPPKDVYEFFTPEGKSVGTYPLSQRPPGAITKEEFNIAEKKASDERAKQTQERAQSSSERQAKAAERSAAAAERGNEKLDIEKQRTAVRMLQDSINVKKVVGANGELSLDWSGETDSKKMKAYHAALGDLDNALQRNKGNVAKAVADLQNKYFPDEEEKPAPPKPKVEQPQQGAASKIVNDISAGIKKAFGKKPKEGLGKRSTPQGTAYEVASQKDYDMLDSGDKYITADGQVRTKK